MARLSELAKQMPHVNCPSEPCMAWEIFQELTWAKKQKRPINPNVVDYALEHLRGER